MRKSSWNEFVGKYPENPQDAFEALCRLLFRTRYGIADSLPYFYNNAGDETVPVTVGNDVMGFQSKFFSGETIDDQQAAQLKHSIETAHKHYANQNKLIVYTNLVFGNPKAGDDKTARQRDVEQIAADNGLTIEWMFGDNILDVVDRTPLARALFFDLSDNLLRIPSSVQKWNELNFKAISSEIAYNGHTIQIDCQKEIAELKGLLAEQKHILISGESGSGKSAIVKQHWLQCKPQTNIAYLLLKGIELDTRSINDLFQFDETYTYTGFRDFFEGHERKILVIDSAEAIVEMQNHTVLRLLVDGLCERGWQFVFTCKSNSADELRRLLKEMSLPVAGLRVDEISEESLENVATTYQLQLPTQSKVLRQLHIPFYLARYCELGDTDIVSPEAFREAVWNNKVRGLRRGGLQQRRETCLMQVVEAQQQSKSYFVNPSGIDHDAAYSLVHEDVLVEMPHRGYSVKHDLYVDWTLDYLLTQQTDTSDKSIALLRDAPKSITYANAFFRWLTSVIDTADARVAAIMDAYVSGELHRQWEHGLLTAIGRSESYVKYFFAQYDAALKANSYALFEKLVDVLEVSCKSVSQYFEYKGEQIPIYKPTGSGWDEAVIFVYANSDAYYLDHLGTVQRLLDGYSHSGGKAVAYDQAAQLSLLIHEIIAEKRINKEEVWTDHLKPWSRLVCAYAWGIRSQLRAIFRELAQNHWTRHQDPYIELMEYVLKDEDNLGKSMIYLSCFDEAINLLPLFWQEQPESSQDKRWHRHDSFGREYVFALNEEFGMDMAYFPASPYQTPVGSLLSAEALFNKNGTKTLDFIIRFTNDCVKAYAQRDTLDDKDTITVQLSDGTQHEVVTSQSLWNLYRGTQSYSIPHLLESIHMALEARLLSDADKKEHKPDWEMIKAWLWRILNHSHSASLYSIVASIAVAHPIELFDELMFLCQDIRFLSYDLTRFSCEISASHKDITFHRHEAWWKERKLSNELPHRQLHLERALLDCQYKYDNEKGDEAKQRLTAAYQVVDRLRSQAEELGKADSTLRFISERINYRGYKKETVVLPTGQEAVLLIPTFPADLQEESNRTMAFAQRMGAMSLRVWADKKFKGEEKDLKGNPFTDNPQLALKTIREIERQIEDGHGDQFLLPGDEYVPYSASAVLLMHYADDLSDADRLECWDRVLTALNDPNAMASNTLSEFGVCIAAIPAMLDRCPERQGELLPVIAGYVALRYVYVNQRICDLMSATIFNGKLWEKFPQLMQEAQRILRNHLPQEDYASMDAETADALLCLITCQPTAENSSIGDMCIDKVAQGWKIRNKRASVMEELYEAEHVVNYILFAPRERVTLLMTNIVPLLDQDYYSESLLGQFLLNAAQMGRYENFWQAWLQFYDRVKAITLGNSHPQVLDDYLFNPRYLSRDFDDWFLLEAKDMAFFHRVAIDFVGCPDAIVCLSRVFGTIGKPFVKQAVTEVFHPMIANHHLSLDDRQKRNVNYYLEKITKKVLAENDSTVRTDMQYKEQLITILEYMRDNGSTEASEMIKIL